MASAAARMGIQPAQFRSSRHPRFSLETGTLSDALANTSHDDVAERHLLNVADSLQDVLH